MSIELEQLESKLDQSDCSITERVATLVKLGAQYMQIDLAKALSFSKQAHQLAAENNLVIQKGLAINNFGVYEYLKGNAELALDHFITADKILAQSKVWEDRIIAKTNIGLVHTKTQQYDKCLQIYKEVEAEIANIPQEIRHAQVYINIDAAYTYLKQPSNALVYTQKALAICERLQSAFGLAISHGNMGGTYITLGEYDKARKHIELAIAYSKQHNFGDNLSTVLVKLILVNIAEQKWPQALAAAEETLEVSHKVGNKESELAALENMIAIYENMDNYKAALAASRKYITAKEQFINTEKARNVSELTLKYEAEKKEAQIKQLEIDQLNSEMKAIKAQMNPHFIFNALNSIQELFFIGDKRIASKQINNFGLLMRKILNASNATTITLKEELEILETYLNLEALRFEEAGFTYTIHNELSDFETEQLQLPPMLLQPYVENAIKHGLLHIKNNKNLNLHFKYKPSSKVLHCIITDNGIGRAAAAEINRAINPIHRSFSTEANEKRLQILNRNREEKIGVHYTDLPQGTQVEILIPIN